MRFVAKIRQTGEPAARNPPGAAVVGALAVRHPPRIFRKRLHPFMRRIAVRIQERIRQPAFQQLPPRARFRIHRIWIRLPARNIRGQRAMIAGMQHIVRRDLGELHGKFRAICVGDRMQHHVDLLEHGSRLRVVQKLIAQLQNVTGAGNFVGVLPPGINDGCLQRGLFGHGAKLRRRRQRHVGGPQILAEIAAAHPVHIRRRAFSRIPPGSIRFSSGLIGSSH